MNMDASGKPLVIGPGRNGTSSSATLHAACSVMPRSTLDGLILSVNLRVLGFHHARIPRKWFQREQRGLRLLAGWLFAGLFKLSRRAAHESLCHGPTLKQVCITGCSCEGICKPFEPTWVRDGRRTHGVQQTTVVDKLGCGCLLLVGLPLRA